VEKLSNIFLFWSSTALGAAKAFLFSFRAFLLPTAQSFQKSHLAPAISLAPAATALLPLPAQAVEGLWFYKNLGGWIRDEYLQTSPKNSL